MRFCSFGQFQRNTFHWQETLRVESVKSFLTEHHKRCFLAFKRNDVPQFLRDGSFFKALSVDDDSVFEVPEDSFKFNTTVFSDEELKLLLRATRFWELEKVPAEAALFVLLSGGDVEQSGANGEAGEIVSFDERIARVKSVSTFETITEAIKEGFGLEVARALCSRGYPSSAESCEAAATVGDVDSLMFLHAEGCPWDERTTSAAAHSGHLPCLKYALDFGCPSEPHLMKVAAGGGHIEILKYLLTTGALFDTETITTAVEQGHVECVRFLHGEGCTMNPGLCFVAARHDRLECLQYLHEQCGLPLTGVSTCAAGCGNLRALQFAHENGDVWNQFCCEAAGRGNHLDCLRYTREHGCPWDEGTLIAATAHGSWACVRYALWHGCPCFKTAYTLVMCLVSFATFVLLSFVPVNDYLLRVSQIVTYLIPVLIHLFRMYNHELTFISPSTRNGAVVVAILVALPLLVYNLCHGLSAVRSHQQRST